MAISGNWFSTAPTEKSATTSTSTDIQAWLALQQQLDNFVATQQARKIRRAMWVVAFVSSWLSFVASVWMVGIAWPFAAMAAFWLVVCWMLYSGMVQRA